MIFGNRNSVEVIIRNQICRKFNKKIAFGDNLRSASLFFINVRLFGKFILFFIRVVGKLNIQK